MNSLDLSVLVLAKREAANLRELLPAVHRVLEQGIPRYELLVVVERDDAETEAVARTCGATVVVQEESGYGAAFRDGFRRAAGRYVVALDADLSHDPDLILDLWAARGNAGLVIASRYVPGGHATMPASRKVLSRLLNTVVRRGLSLNVRDVSSGFRLYRREAVRPDALRARHFDVLEEALIDILADGWEISEIPFHYRPRRHGQSTVRLLAFGFSFVRSFPRMWRLRNSAFSADYDERAFNSVIPLQRYWQRTRHKLIGAFVDPRTRILDLGCGSSRIILGLSDAVALDIQLKKLRRIRGRHRRVVQGTITSLPFGDRTFDTVICSQVIEHVPRELVSFAEMNRVLRLGGTLVIGTPDYGTVTWPLLEWAYGLVHPDGYVHEHINHYTAQTLSRELTDNGFGIVAHAYVGGGELIYKAEKVREAGAVANEPAGRPAVVGTTT